MLKQHTIITGSLKTWVNFTKFNESKNLNKEQYISLNAKYRTNASKTNQKKICVNFGIIQCLVKQFKLKKRSKMQIVTNEKTKYRLVFPVSLNDVTFTWHDREMYKTPILEDIWYQNGLKLTFILLCTRHTQVKNKLKCLARMKE